MKAKTLLLLCALVVAPATTRAQFTLLSDSASWVKVRKYYTAQPVDSALCLYGFVSADSALIDSVTIAKNCHFPAFGALGYIPDWALAHANRDEVENSLCDLLRNHPGWKFAGVIVGIEDKTRRPLIWSCWVKET